MHTVQDVIPVTLWVQFGVTVIYLTLVLFGFRRLGRAKDSGDPLAPPRIRRQLLNGSVVFAIVIVAIPLGAIAAAWLLR